MNGNTNNNIEIGNRLRILLEDNNMSQAELAKKMNTTTATISRYITGKRQPKGEVVAKMASLLNTSSDYILTGETDLNTTPYYPTPKLPILGSVRAGVGGFAYEEQIGYEEAYMSNCDPETHFYLKVKGDSMEPRIKEGDLALVKRQSDVECGELAIVLVDGEEGVIKKVIKKENSIELHSFNLYYPPRTFEGKEMERVKIMGKVLRTMSIW